MANKDGNNGNGNTPLGTPNKRAGKKQDTQVTPERMKPVQAEMMEIDSSEDCGTKSPPKTPPRQGDKVEGKGSKGMKAGETSDVAINVVETPPSTPQTGRETRAAQGKQARPNE